MPEATVILFDNSEFMRNADYIPSRLGAQVDTVGMIAQAKCDSNPENTVAMVATSGRPNVVLTLTSDVAKVFTSTDRIPLNGTVDILNSFHVASLLLNHRVNKIHHQRIIALVGSPILPSGVSEEEFMTKIEAVAKKLKASRVALDIVSFGEVQENERFLRALFQIVCGDDPSLGTFLTVGPGTKLIADCVMCSSIVLGEAAAGGAGGAASAAAAGVGAGFMDYGGFDDDPELALAIAQSIQDEERRKAAAAAAAAEADKKPSSEQPPKPSSDTIMADDDDDLNEVLKMTSALQTPTPASKPQESSTAPSAPTKQNGGVRSVETAQLNLPLDDIMSPDFQAMLLQSVGVDPTLLVQQAQSNKEEDKKKDDDKKDDKKDDGTEMTDK